MGSARRPEYRLKGVRDIVERGLYMRGKIFKSQEGGQVRKLRSGGNEVKGRFWIVNSLSHRTKSGGGGCVRGT